MQLASRVRDWEHWSLPGPSVALSQQPAPAARGIYSAYTALPTTSPDREETRFRGEKSLQITSAVSLGQAKPPNGARLNALSLLCVINNGWLFHRWETNHCGGKPEKEPQASQETRGGAPGGETRSNSSDPVCLSGAWKITETGCGWIKPAREDVRTG